MQLFNLDADPAEQNNLLLEHPDRVDMLLSLLERQVKSGRCTPGKSVSNDREIAFLPKGVAWPPSEKKTLSTD